MTWRGQRRHRHARQAAGATRCTPANKRRESTTAYHPSRSVRALGIAAPGFAALVGLPPLLPWWAPVAATRAWQPTPRKGRADGSPVPLPLGLHRLASSAAAAAGLAPQDALIRVPLFLGGSRPILAVPQSLASRTQMHRNTRSFVWPAVALFLSRLLSAASQAPDLCPGLGRRRRRRRVRALSLALPPLPLFRPIPTFSIVFSKCHPVQGPLHHLHLSIPWFSRSACLSFHPLSSFSVCLFFRRRPRRPASRPCQARDTALSAPSGKQHHAAVALLVLLANLR